LWGFKGGGHGEGEGLVASPVVVSCAHSYGEVANVSRGPGDHPGVGVEE